VHYAHSCTPSFRSRVSMSAFLRWYFRANIPDSRSRPDAPEPMGRLAPRRSASQETHLRATPNVGLQAGQQSGMVTLRRHSIGPIPLRTKLRILRLGFVACQP